MRIEFELDKPETDALFEELEDADVDFDFRSVSKMGGVLESAAFVIPLAADTIAILQAFCEARPWAKPISIIIVNGNSRIVIESAELDAKEITVRLSEALVQVEVKR
ncbi:hypothetical protein ACC676_01130 [Rhizobium ruizarguesonis]